MNCCLQRAFTRSNDCPLIIKNTSEISGKCKEKIAPFSEENCFNRFVCSAPIIADLFKAETCTILYRTCPCFEKIAVKANWLIWSQIIIQWPERVLCLAVCVIMDWSDICFVNKPFKLTMLICEKIIRPCYSKLFIFIVKTCWATNLREQQSIKWA